MATIVWVVTNESPNIVVDDDDVGLSVIAVCSTSSAAVGVLFTEYPGARCVHAYPDGGGIFRLDRDGKPPKWVAITPEPVDGYDALAVITGYKRNQAGGK